jgi:hypothetical protein
MSDVKLINNAVIVEGNMGIGTANPRRPMHAESEVHTGGPSGGFSFADRHKTAFVDAPQNAERWVLYAADEAARLWSGEDVLTVKRHNGDSWCSELKGRLVVEKSVDIHGSLSADSLGGKVSLLSGRETGPEKLKVISLFTTAVRMHSGLTGGDGPYALFHDFDKAASRDVLVINAKGGYKSGVRIDGNVQVNGVMTQSSSAALKENVAALSPGEAMAALQRLNPVKFNYRADEQRQQHVGFIAEEVPELVAKAGRTAVSAMDIVAVLTTVVQDMQKALARLSEKVDALTPALAPAEVQR